MRFQVPQFIEIEDKIFGPLTIKQFIYLAGGGGLAFIIFRFLPLMIAIPLIIVAIGFSLLMAFYTVNNKPFIGVVQSAVTYFFSNKLYLWKKQDRKPISKTEPTNTEKAGGQLFIPKLSDSKLKDITWSLDINETVGGKE
ncbi:MAG: PrgI family protein [bacterium]